MPRTVFSLCGSRRREISYFTIWMLFSDIHGPRCGPMATIQDSSEARDGWEDQAVIEDSQEDSLLLVKALRLFLYQILVNTDGTATAVDYTSSIGPKYMRWSVEYFWNSRPWTVTVSRYTRSNSSVCESGLLQEHRRCKRFRLLGSMGSECSSVRHDNPDPISMGCCGRRGQDQPVY